MNARLLAICFAAILAGPLLVCSVRPPPGPPDLERFRENLDGGGASVEAQSSADATRLCLALVRRSIDGLEAAIVARAEIALDGTALTEPTLVRLSNFERGDELASIEEGLAGAQRTATGVRHLYVYDSRSPHLELPWQFDGERSAVDLVVDTESSGDGGLQVSIASQRLEYRRASNHSTSGTTSTPIETTLAVGQPAAIGGDCLYLDIFAVVLSPGVSTPRSRSEWLQHFEAAARATETSDSEDAILELAACAEVLHDVRAFEVARELLMPFARRNSNVHAVWRRQPDSTWPEDRGAALFALARADLGAQREYGYSGLQFGLHSLRRPSKWPNGTSPRVHEYALHVEAPPVHPKVLTEWRAERTKFLDEWRSDGDVHERVAPVLRWVLWSAPFVAFAALLLNARFARPGRVGKARATLGLLALSAVQSVLAAMAVPIAGLVLVLGVVACAHFLNDVHPRGKRAIGFPTWIGACLSGVIIAMMFEATGLAAYPLLEFASDERILGPRPNVLPSVAAALFLFAAALRVKDEPAVRPRICAAVAIGAALLTPSLLLGFLAFGASTLAVVVVAFFTLPIPTRERATLAEAQLSH